MKCGQWSFLILTAALVACTSRGTLEKRDAQFDDIRDEFEKVVQVETIETPAEPAQSQAKGSVEKAVKEPKSSAKKKKAKSLKKGKAKVAEAKPKTTKHLPDLEDAEGFIGRRPKVDPFVVGEKTTLSIKYFNVTAGVVDVMVLPYKEVNGSKSYHFKVEVRSNKTFSMFYTVRNLAETFMDFEELIPHTLTFDNNESSRVVESRSFFDWEKLQAREWEKKVSKKKGEEKKEIEWDILPYSQNIISALFYLRVFEYKVGKKLAFRVSDDGKNYVFTGEVLRKEKLDTPLGKLDTFVIKPTFTLNNNFKPSGENLLWITADDRKRIVRVESKVKIGTLVGQLISMK